MKQIDDPEWRVTPEAPNFCPLKVISEVPGEGPSKRLEGYAEGYEQQKGLQFLAVSPCFYWRPRDDSNVRPLP